MKTQKMNTQVVGNIGLYYVCYHLSRLGLNAMPTSRNAKGIKVSFWLQPKSYEAKKHKNAWHLIVQALDASR
jgi:hypothetical protein